MAQVHWNESSLKLMFLNGIKENGDPNLVTKTFRNVNETATPEQILAVAQGLASLVTYSLYSVERNDTSEIIEG
ncbi:DUF1659 domain-containing protein [Cytobacillus oceanisediminis]|uniref:DUF1659 domain-containing protein n=2 Tax=Niallia TaxID=2837506 RepID=A0A941GG45_NIACI|nr:MULTISPECIES: DUF1659 domain-containing protein [Bacillaceae]EOR21723.1 hypothetical protein A499_21785 [Niallia nealsonii AAU1]MBQ6447531.1 DUF1659 domain-containing protein [Bacillus sp. (in: firmicutes)]MDU1846890.1 DUF1659 domain-containing protein [Niallia nealsonii]MBZ9534017.1 DUF1659 domain-containing protein [Cytobacillus oceanisediminis]MCB5238475.1 DUF1659 domain-containing protein [Niallia circulans]